MATNLSEKKKRGVQTSVDITAFLIGPRNAALFMHVNFKLEWMGKPFLYQSQTYFSLQHFFVFVCYFTDANCIKGDQQTLEKIQQTC